MTPRTQAYALILAALLFLGPIDGFAATDVEARFQSFLRTAYPWPDIKVADFSLQSPVSASEIESFIIERGMPGATSVLIVLRNGELVRAHAYVKAFDRVVMTSRALKAGHVLGEGDVYSTLMDVTRIPKNTYAAVDDAVGVTLLRAVSANSPLTDAVASRTPVVQKGKKVVLVVESPSFRILAPGETREKAIVGKDVKAVNLASKRAVYGVLIDEDTVKVEY